MEPSLLALGGVKKSEMKGPLLLAVCASLFAAGALGQVDCPNPHDSNTDGAVTITDLLDLLGLFGDVDTDQDGVWDSVDDCVDTTACNYAADPTEPCAYIDVLGACGGDCEGDGDGDGICDDEDDCVGVVDECGVCNGLGPTEVVIEDIVITYDSVFLPLDNDWYVFPISADTTFSYTCAPFFGACGDPVSYQGYDYATVLIGDQCWFAENLRSENYENGDAIPSGLSNGEWSSAFGATTVYGDNASNLETYGRLYNWYAVDEARGLCPSGWHVPTDGEWTQLINLFGGHPAAGPSMKASPEDNPGWNGTNASGFTGLGGGLRYDSGGYDSLGGNGSFWSSSLHTGNFAWFRNLNIWEPNVQRHFRELTSGLSVRCIQD